MGQDKKASVLDLPFSGMRQHKRPRKLRGIATTSSNVTTLAEDRCFCPQRFLNETILSQDSSKASAVKIRVSLSLTSAAHTTSRIPNSSQKRMLKISSPYTQRQACTSFQSCAKFLSTPQVPNRKLWPATLWSGPPGHCLSQKHPVAMGWRFWMAGFVLQGAGYRRIQILASV